jgi:hypothetical protein
MTEGLFPIALHQDPRYFVRGKGGFWKRTGYAMSREFITRGDDGRNHFNTPELAGNAVAAGISNVYHPAADRSLANTANKWEEQCSRYVLQCSKGGLARRAQEAFRTVEPIQNEFFGYH